MPNIRVNIWCCDLNGDYSGYGELEGLTYQRGYQITDDNGEVESGMFSWMVPRKSSSYAFSSICKHPVFMVSQYTWP